MSGVRLAASYSYLPNCLGFCGSQRKEDLELMERFMTGKVGESKIIPILRKLEAAYFYYCLIARKNGIRDPFNQKVIEAYWLGNPLLEKVSHNDIVEMIRRDFVKPHLLSKKEAEQRIKSIPAGAKAQHSFHVFILGPIAGRIDMSELSLKDICRTGFGKVLKKGKDHLIVDFQPVKKEKKSYVLGKSKKLRINWNKNILKSVRKGQWVSFHWGTAVQVLNKKQLENIIKYTENNLRLIN